MAATALARHDFKKQKNGVLFSPANQRKIRQEQPIFTFGYIKLWELFLFNIDQ